MTISTNNDSLLKPALGFIVFALTIYCVITFTRPGFTLPTFNTSNYQESLQKQTEINLQSIKIKVAKDFESQFNRARLHGTKYEVCAQAQIVTASWNQAGNIDKYRYWAGIQKIVCKF